MVSATIRFWLGSEGRLSGFMSSMDRFTETTQEDGPEPAKEKCANETATGCIEKYPVRTGFRIPTGAARYGKTSHSTE